MFPKAPLVIPGVQPEEETAFRCAHLRHRGFWLSPTLSLSVGSDLSELLDKSEEGIEKPPNLFQL